MSKLEEVSKAVEEGKLKQIEAIVGEALGDDIKATEILDAMIDAMSVVGEKFRTSEIFVPEMLMSAHTMKKAVEVIQPLLVESAATSLGTCVIGTITGDLHDIGKNLVGMMCEGSGFEVINLGFNVPPEVFVQAIKEHQPDIIGMSALLTTTMRAMGYTIKAIEEAGLRDQVKIMVGGAPVDRAFADRIGADGYGSNGPAGADLCKQFMGIA